MGKIEGEIGKTNEMLLKGKSIFARKLVRLCACDR